MTVLCPEGHESTAEDWCDICGSPIAPDLPGAVGSPTPNDSASGLPGAVDGGVGVLTQPAWPPAGAPSGPACPVCAEPRSGSRYCEACAYDFDTGAPLAAPTPEPLQPAPPTPSSSASSASAASAASVSPTAGSGGAGAGWVAEVCPDRAFFDRNDDEVEFPDPPTSRLVVLSGERTLIGRRSPRRDLRPEIDLSVAPEDRGASRAHAFLDHTGDGRLTVTDLGSANGTWIGDDPDPISPGRSVPLVDGDRLYLGSFTRITVRRSH